MAESEALCQEMQQELTKTKQVRACHFTSDHFMIIFYICTVFKVPLGGALFQLPCCFTVNPVLFKNSSFFLVKWLLLKVQSMHTHLFDISV